MFKEYFIDLGFNEHEADIFKALFILGTKPASTIAKYLGMERTGVYKILQKLTKENLVYETNKDGIKHFFIPNIEILKTYTEKKINKYKELNTSYENIKSELQEFENKKSQNFPKITIFDSNSGIINIHNDIIENTLKNKYISIKLFASNIIDSQVTIPSNLKQSSIDLFKNLKLHNISIETFLGNGVMLMENISKTYDIEIMEKLPASNSAINIFIVGTIIYIIIFKESSFGIKIESEDLAYTMHFLFDKIQYKD
ncbi:MAG: helix-turn-helix domain-containing protein [Candidatus Gracilibacteria bacterium]